jgi:hypothetical protein
MARVSVQRSFVKTWIEGDVTHTLTAKAEISQIGTQLPSFSVTGDIYSLRRGRKVWEAGGCLHGEINEHISELVPYIKWHLYTIGEGPLHYIANAMYWWELAKGISRWQKSEHYGHDDFSQILCNHVIYGATPTYDNRDPVRFANKHIMLAWLKCRWAEMNQNFKRDMSRLFNTPAELDLLASFVAWQRTEMPNK